MSEPEELILEAAHVATRVARETWRRYGPSPSARNIALTAVRGRLEMFVTALFRAPIEIAAMEPPAPRSWLARLSRGRAPHANDSRFLCGTDGRRVYLPPSLDASGSHEDTLAIYRLLAVQQTARLTRGTPGMFARIANTAVREWFIIAEAAAVDRWTAAQAPGLVGTLRRARADALAARASRTPRDAVERQIRIELASEPGEDVLDLRDDRGPEQSLAWAERTAARHAIVGKSQAVEPVWYWGRIVEGPSTLDQSLLNLGEADDPRAERRARVAEMRRRPRARKAAEDEDDERPGTWVIRTDEPQESVEDPVGLQRPADRDRDADPEGLADSLSELPEARMVRTPEPPREVLRSGDEIPRREQAPSRALIARGIAYPEWDYQAGHYRQPGAVVRQPPAPEGDAIWATVALARHARLVRRVRARFERLRPRRVRLDRQTDGSEIDIAAYVTAAADIKAGATIDGRIYVAQRPARRELVVSLLVDVSASTDAWVSSARRIVDVEKEALLVVCEALDALGDPYGVFAFSGEGPQDVMVLPLKNFREQTGLSVYRRIAALDSDRYTRIGAPIRHVTAALCRERPARRLLLILTDGKPNDVDAYEGRYGVEDTRQAVAEARHQGVSVFCLTVDRDAPRYAGRIFGPRGFAVLHRAEQLPTVLIEVLRQIIRA